MKIWKETGRATATDVKTFTVGMVMKDVPLLEATLLELATPSSPRYGKWLTKEEADELTSTPAPIAAEVTRWATSTGAACKRRSEALSCSGTVSQIEKLLGGELSYFVSPTRARRRRRGRRSGPRRRSRVPSPRALALTRTHPRPLAGQHQGRREDHPHLHARAGLDPVVARG